MATQDTSSGLKLALPHVTRPLHETTAERMRRVCKAPLKHFSNVQVSSFLPVAVVLLVLGMTGIGLLVADTCANFFESYSDMIMERAGGG